MTEAPAPALTGPTLWAMTRPGFLVITAVAVLLGWATAAHSGFDGGRALATLVLALLAHAGANVLNDYHDACNGADAANTEGLFPFTGGSRLIQRGQVSVRTTRAVAWGLLGLVALGGLWLAAHSRGGLWLIGLSGLLLAWAYSAPPLRLMTRGWGELAVALTWWLVVLGADYVQRQAFFWLPACSGIGLALLVANILLINGVPDAAADRRVGKLTLAVRLGPSGAAVLYASLALMAHAWLALGVWAWALPVPVLWGCLSGPLSAAAALLLWRRRLQPQRLAPAIVLTIAAAVLHGLGVAAGLARLAWLGG